ncbi:MAG: hypothetical protein WA463_07090, partial [Terriglobales bacterium]
MDNPRPHAGIDQSAPGTGSALWHYLATDDFPARNASANAFTAQLTFNWRSDAGNGKGTAAVPMQPYETRVVDVAALQAKGTIPANAQWAYVSITAPIRPDDLLAVAASFDSAGKLGAQTPFSDQVANHWEGGRWEVDANHDTIIAVGNAGTTASKAQITFYYNSGQGKYQVEQTLGPEKQLWLDMGKVIGTQVADKNGNTIPSAVMSGTYELRSLTNQPTEGLFEGKLVVDKTYGYAAHGCMQCCGYNLPYMGFDPFNLLLNGSGNQSVWGENGCNSWDYDITSYFYNGWGTGNTQIATANHNLITGVGVGSTTNFSFGYVPITTEVSLHRSCPNTYKAPSSPVNVRVPTDSRIVATTNSYSISATTNPACPSGQAGWYRTVTKIVTDQFGADIHLDGQSLSELVTITVPNDLGISSTTTGSAVTSGGGYFGDIYLVCSPRCPSSPGETDAIQQIVDVLPTTGATYHLNGIT